LVFHTTEKCGCSFEKLVVVYLTTAAREAPWAFTEAVFKLAKRVADVIGCTEISPA